MNIEDMIMNGASEEEIAEAIARIKTEKAAIEEQERQSKECAEAAKHAKDKKEALKTEGRAYLINALQAYAEAFDLLDEDEMWSQEGLDKIEDIVIKLEEMIPTYIKLVELQNKFDDEFFKGLF